MKSRKISKKKTSKGKFKFIDLFAGIGGMHLAFEKLGGKCVFSSEKDEKACDTYEANFGIRPAGDIRTIEPDEIPDHDLLAAGFPCQGFSIAGVSKLSSMGRSHGFEDATRGTLFFDICRIAEKKKPKVLFLENVKNLQWHDKGQTLKIIKESLHQIGYTISVGVFSSVHFVPQRRERIFIACIRSDLELEFTFPDPPNFEGPVLRDILEKKVNPKYTLNDHLWSYLKERKRIQKAKGNGFGYGLFDRDETSRTLPARYGKDGSDILIKQRNKNPRRLTPTECSRLMGFDSFDSKKGFTLNQSEQQCYKQFGNAVVPQVVHFIGKELMKTMNWNR